MPRATTAATARKLAAAYPQGITCQQILSCVAKQTGRKLSEATLRKYVQHGLLSSSRRRAIKGEPRGSRGYYPPNTVVQILLIQAHLDRGGCLADLIGGRFALLSQLDALRDRANLVRASVVGKVASGRSTSSRTLREQIQASAAEIERGIAGLEALVNQSLPVPSTSAAAAA